MQELQYQPSAAARPVVVEHDGVVTRIAVAMPGLYVPVPRWVGRLDLLSLVVGPLWWVGTLLIGFCLQLPKPPRAVFEVTGEQLTMTLREPASGETRIFNWPRAAVVEARANRYARGLWVNVAGHVKETYLSDLTRQTVEKLEIELRAALADHTPPGCGD